MECNAIRFRWLTTLLITVNCLWLPVVPVSAQDHLKVDPELLLALKECRQVVDQMPGGFYPGWDFHATPILFYKPGIQDVLVNFPHKPEGFREFQGMHPLQGETLYVRDSETFITYDDQNTITTVDGVTVLVVSDPSSSMRNQINGVLHGQTKEFMGQWLEEWGFERSPYDLIQTILHEAFHAYQDRKAPDKFADEAVVSTYPVLDMENIALTQMEGHLLSEALLAGDDAIFCARLVEFVATRRYRHQRLGESFVEYEHMVEFSEGTAKYIEYRFLQDARDFVATPEMYYTNGFHGYQILPDLFIREMEHLVSATRVPDTETDNSYGTGPLRFRLYFLGAAQALALDKVYPSWKEEIFTSGVYLSDLLTDALDPGETELEAALTHAKERLDYDQIVAVAKRFAEAGEQRIQERVDDILKTNQTLVTLEYSGFEITAMGYTPFGVTRVRDQVAIYDLVPLQIRFGSDHLLTMNNAQPVLVDRETATVSFAVADSLSAFEPGRSQDLQVASFSLKDGACRIAISDNHVRIRLRPQD